MKTPETPKTLYDVFAQIRKDMGHTWPEGAFMTADELSSLKKRPLTGTIGDKKATKLKVKTKNG